MNWMPPETEEGWQECLSAYLDGELEPEERRALEAHLAADPRRNEQLQSLRGLSRVLGEWSVEAPAPDPKHLRELCGALEERVERRPGGWSWLSSLTGWGPRWAFQAAIFLLGVLAGIVGPRLIGHPSGMGQPPAGREIASAPIARNEGAGLNAAISPDQADQLAREVKANGLRDSVIQGLDKNDWQTARQAFETLRRQYPDSGALRELEKNESLRWIKKQLVVAERI
jgi:anti-sigma factor RsiW